MAISEQALDYQPLTRIEADVLTLRAAGLRRSTIVNGLEITTSCYSSRIDRGRNKIGATNLIEEVVEAISSGEVLLDVVTAELDYSRLSRLTPLQFEVYEAMTDPKNYGLPSAGVALSINRNETSFNRLAKRVRYHLGTKDRLQTVVFRLGYEAQKGK